MTEANITSLTGDVHALKTRYNVQSANIEALQNRINFLERIVHECFMSSREKENPVGKKRRRLIKTLEDSNSDDDDYTRSNNNLILANVLVENENANRVIGSPKGEQQQDQNNRRRGNNKDEEANKELLQEPRDGFAETMQTDTQTVALPKKKAVTEKEREDTKNAVLLLLAHDEEGCGGKMSVKQIVSALNSGPHKETFSRIKSGLLKQLGVTGLLRLEKETNMWVLTDMGRQHVASSIAVNRALDHQGEEKMILV